MSCGRVREDTSSSCIVLTSLLVFSTGLHRLAGPVEGRPDLRGGMGEAGSGEHLCYLRRVVAALTKFEHRPDMRAEACQGGVELRVGDHGPLRVVGCGPVSMVVVVGTVAGPPLTLPVPLLVG